MRPASATTIRTALDADAEGILRVHREAFGAEEGETVARLAVKLLGEAAGVLSLVAEDAGGICGHVAFSRVTAAEDGRAIGFLLAPLAVSPARQGCGIGTRLVRRGIREAEAAGAALVFVYGDPAYYGRFGFRRETAEGFTPPQPLKHPDGWLAMRTNDARPLPDAAGISSVPPLDRPELW